MKYLIPTSFYSILRCNWHFCITHLSRNEVLCFFANLTFWLVDLKTEPKFKTLLTNSRLLWNVRLSELLPNWISPIQHPHGNSKTHSWQYDFGEPTTVSLNFSQTYIFVLFFDPHNLFNTSTVYPCMLAFHHLIRYISFGNKSAKLVQHFPSSFNDQWMPLWIPAGLE